MEVEDHGEGISEDKLNYIWDRYYKVDKTHKRSSAGSGIGLAIVREILELHHAQYGVRSEVGQGSVFWFELSRASDSKSDSRLCRIGERERTAAEAVLK